MCNKKCIGNCAYAKPAKLKQILGNRVHVNKMEPEMVKKRHSSV